MASYLLDGSVLSLKASELDICKISALFLSCGGVSIVLRNNSSREYSGMLVCFSSFVFQHFNILLFFTGSSRI